MIRNIRNDVSGRVAYGLWINRSSTANLTDLQVNEVESDGIRIDSDVTVDLTALSIFACGGSGIHTLSPVKLRNARLIGNNRGVHIAGGSPDLGTLTDFGLNAIYNNDHFQVFNATNNTILAQVRRCTQHKLSPTVAFSDGWEP